jgi:FKBP-type peptidyl-prolyl cis-trans isomerase
VVLTPRLGKPPLAAGGVLLVCGVLTVSAVVALAVGVSTPQIPPPEPIALDEPAPARPEPAAPQAVDPTAFVTRPDGMAVADLVLGTGELVVGTDTAVVVDFVAWQGTRNVGSSYNRPTPTRVPRDADTQGWLRALDGMRAGGVRQIRVPSEREGGREVLVETTVHTVLVPPVPVVVPESSRTRLPSGIEFAELTPGVGNPPPPGDRVAFDYAVFTQDGTELDSSWRRAAPVRLRLGVDPLVFAPVLEGLAPGGRRQAWVPPEVAFPQGRPPDGVPAGQSLVLVVELREQPDGHAH